LVIGEIEFRLTPARFHLEPKYLSCNDPKHGFLQDRRINSASLHVPRNVTAKLNYNVVVVLH
jgi:hypothetical protein